MARECGLRAYGTIKPSFWIGTTGRAMRQAGSEVQLVALYLITNPHANMLGLYYCPLAMMCQELALPRPRIVKALGTLAALQFATYDLLTEFVWVYQMAKHGLGTLQAQDRQAVPIRRLYQDLPDNPFISAFFDRYGSDLTLIARRASEALPKPLDPVPVPDPVLDRGGAGGGVLAAPDALKARFDVFWSVYPRKVGKDAAWRAWQKRAPVDDLLSTMLAAIAFQRQTPQWTKDGGEFIPHPSTWLNQARWEDARTVDVAPASSPRVKALEASTRAYLESVK